MATNEFRNTTVIKGVCLIAAALVSVPVDAQEPVETTEITGTLQIFGCAPGAAQFRLFSVPLALGSREQSAAPAEAGRPKEADISATRDPHTFAFRVPGVTLGPPHQLRIQTGPGACGRFFWESPQRGLAIPGGPPVRLIGYAVRSQIEVLGNPAGERTERRWVGAEHLDVSDPANSRRQFRWYTDMPGVTRGVLQVSTRQFPKHGEDSTSCATPKGLVHSASFPARTGSWIQPPAVNFFEIAQRLASGPEGALQTMSLHLGAPLYVRVVPVSGRTYRCDSIEDGPAPWVVLAKGDVQAASEPTLPVAPVSAGPSGPDVKITWGTKYIPPHFETHPTMPEFGFRVVKGHKLNPADVKPTYKWDDFLKKTVQVPPKDYWGSLFVASGLADNTAFNKGALVWLEMHAASSSGLGYLLEGLLEAGVKLVTGVIDAVGLTVNPISQAWEDIQEAVVKVVAQAIEAAKIAKCGSGSLCETLISKGLQTGLAAMGLPPTLPNWDEVVDKGFEYMAYQVASQAGVAGVPGITDLTKEAAETIVKAAVKEIDYNRGAGGDLPDWLMLDLGQEPAILLLNIQREWDGPGVTNLIHISGNDMFQSTSVGLPGHWPAGTVAKYGQLAVPVALRPNLKGFVAPTFSDGTPYSDYDTAKAARDFWHEKVDSTFCTIFGVSGSGVVGNLILKKKEGLALMFVTSSQPKSFPPYLPCAAN